MLWMEVFLLFSRCEMASKPRNPRATEWPWKKREELQTPSIYNEITPNISPKESNHSRSAGANSSYSTFDFWWSVTSRRKRAGHLWFTIRIDFMHSSQLGRHFHPVNTTSTGQEVFYLQYLLYSRSNKQSTASFGCDRLTKWIHKRGYNIRHFFIQFWPRRGTNRISLARSIHNK